MELTLPKKVFSLLEPIKASIKITNISNEVVYLQPFSNPYHDFDFEVEDVGRATAKRVPQTTYHDQRVAHALGSYYSGHRGLKPGGTFKVDMMPNLVSDMTSETRYAIVLAVPHWPSPAILPATRKVVRSAPMMVDVAGQIRDPKN